MRMLDISQIFLTRVFRIGEAGLNGAVERSSGSDLRSQHPASDVEETKQLVVKLSGHTSSPQRKGLDVGSWCVRISKYLHIQLQKCLVLHSMSIFDNCFEKPLRQQSYTRKNQLSSLLLVLYGV